MKPKRICLPPVRSRRGSGLLKLQIAEAKTGTDGFVQVRGRG